MIRLESLALALALALPAAAQDIPLPEHPRPDFMRTDWVNLNGPWRFRLDPADEGVAAGWERHPGGFDREITVPFSWGAPLSGVPDSADTGWYAREIVVPGAWRGRRVFLVVGASDWKTTVWLDGNLLGEHRGGYTPFEFDLTPLATSGRPQTLVIRVDDAPHEFKLEGKQGYGPARGIWQTPYLEARGTEPIATVHLTPDPSASSARVDVSLMEAARADVPLTVFFRNGERGPVTGFIRQGSRSATLLVDLPGFRWWSREDPYLYEIDVRAGPDGEWADVVSTYFGMRTISVVDLPGTDIPYVALNGKPVYLQLTLDQAYHPQGYYTFTTDDFTRREVLRARQIGLNGLRIHVKVGLPRKLYWADRLGMLVMADLPNSWGEPGPEMRAEAEFALRGMIERDFNHPSIFAWVLFNETWGLSTTIVEDGREVGRFLPETKRWVEAMVSLARSLDRTRLIEDNSVCCGVGHTVTDINSWHAYLPGWRWSEVIAEAESGTFPGSTWNMEEGYEQARQPNLNSEFGNVWGYDGSTGDVDWSWDYHRAINAFRKAPKVAGWLYTEHHDVINEWNGYWRYDRSLKYTGLGELAAGMSLRDLHAPLYVAVGEPADLSIGVEPGERVEVPLFASFLADVSDSGGGFTLEWETTGWDGLGRRMSGPDGARGIEARSWWAGPLEGITVTMPEGPAVVVLAVRLVDRSGTVRHTNFQTFVVADPDRGAASVTMPLEGGKQAIVLRREAGEPSDARWTMRHWDVLEGLKENGAGSGFFEYRFPWEGAADSVAAARFTAELSAKQLYDKDRDAATATGGDYMRGGGTHSPHRNPNAYPMTDETTFPSAVRVSVNGHDAGRFELADDPADHRGILSWHAQLRDGRLREAGSYGYLVDVPIPPGAVQAAAAAGEFVVRLTVDDALPGGLAVYGSRFGRYPLDPSVVLVPR